MKKYFIFFLVIILSIAIVLILKSTITINLLANNSEKYIEVEQKVCISSEGQYYIDRRQDGMKVGDKIPEIQLTTYLGERIDLYGKKIFLTFGTPNCSSCKIFHPILQEWASNFSNIEFILVSDGKPEKKDLEKYIESDIKLILDYKEVIKHLNHGYLFNSFLINEQGEIIYRFYFETFLYKELSEIVEEFNQQSIVSTKGDLPVTIGKPFTLPVLKDSRGRVLDIQNYKGKITFLFLIIPGCYTCTLTYPIIQYFNDEYKNKINTVVIFDFYDDIRNKTISEYYKKYSLHELYRKIDYAKNPDELLKKTGLNGVDVFFDHTGKAYLYSQASSTPTIVVLDEELKLINIFALGSCYGTKIEQIDFVLEQIIYNRTK